ncbi:MAG TPA: DMT family transporter [Terriglobales bacterium]|jgi:DME family drug/metabolite transporter|nr:DMT family transporter [Terriglobales bacterium]
MGVHTRKPVRGHLYIAAATFLWGVAASLGRAAFTGRLPGLQVLRPIDPLILSQSRATFSFLVILPVLWLLRGRRSLRLPAADLGQIFLIGVLGVAASNYFYYLAIQKTNVATAIIVQYTAPVWVLLYTVARGQQRPTLQRVAAVGLAVTGIALVIGLFGSGGLRLDTVGVLAALLAAFSFAFYNIGGHDILARHDRWTVLLYTTCSASLFWVLVNPPWKIAAGHYSGQQWLFLLLFSLLSVLAPFSFYFAGLQHLEPTRAIVVSCLEPVFSILIAAIALGEVMRPLQVLGIVIVLAAIIVVQLRDRRSAEPMPLVEPIE